MSRTHRPSFPAAPGWLTHPLAHRGLHAPGGPVENTLEAYAAARDAHFGVELDVRRSADGVPVVHHDRTLADGRAIADVARADLPAFVPTLAAALDVLRTVPVMVELKADRLRTGRLEAAVAAVLATHGGPHCIASFHPGSVAWFTRHAPATVRVITVSAQADGGMPRLVRDRLATLRPFGPIRPHAVSYDVRGLPTEATMRWREDGGMLTTWTVHDAATLSTARAHADGMIFETIIP